MIPLDSRKLRIAALVALCVGAGLAIASTFSGAQPSAAGKPAVAAASVPSQPPFPPSALRNSAAPGAQELIGVGDKLRITFFERLEFDEDKWAGRRKPGRLSGFVPRPELSGDYVVQPDGTIAIPLLGTVVAARRTVAGLDADLTRSFFDASGRPAIISIALMDRAPIYVVGPVRQPGVFKFEPGVTTLHAVALAGGFHRSVDDRWTSVEAARETTKQQIYQTRQRRLLAQIAVLQGEVEGVPPMPPARLKRMLGDVEANAAIAQEIERRAPVARAREERRKALAMIVDAAREGVELARQRLVPLQGSIDARRTRVATLQGLRNQGNLDRTVLAMAQTELNDAEERKIIVQNQVAEAELRASSAEVELRKFAIDTKVELEREIAVRERELDEVDGYLSTAGGIFEALTGTPRGVSLDESTVVFEIVRQSQAGQEVLPAQLNTPLRPGDLLRIRHKPDGAPEPGR